MKIDLTRTKIHSANIQSELYHQCRNKGINILLEYSVKYEGEKRSRFDAVIYNKEHEALCIIEVKSYASVNKKANDNTKQASKYRFYNLPIYFLTRMEKVSELIELIITTYPESLEDTPKLKTYKTFTLLQD